MKIFIGQVQKSAYIQKHKDLLAKARSAFIVCATIFGSTIVLMETVLKDFTKSSPVESSVFIESSTGTGSGFLTGPTTIITARHVVDDLELGETLRVTFRDQEKKPITTEASLFWKANKSDSTGSSKSDRETDFAILKLINQTVLPEGTSGLRIGNSSTIINGDEIICESYPSGIKSYEEGKISNTSLQVGSNEGEVDVLQLSINVMQGSSGGAIRLKSTNEIIGVLSSGFEKNGSSIIFAPKMNKLKELADSMGIDLTN